MSIDRYEAIRSWIVTKSHLNWPYEPGDVFDLGAYISLHKGDDSVTLDGRFFLDQLKALVAYMEEHLD